MSTELRDIDHSYHDAWLGSKSKLGYFQWLADRAEAAEARAAQLQAERDTLKVKCEQLESEIKYLRSTDHAADLAFERMAPIDWRDSYNSETPLGQALDGLGDEVEP